MPNVMMEGELSELIETEAVVPYLRYHGWELLGQGAFGSRWRIRTDSETRNIAIPTHTVSTLDRNAMLTVALRTLSEVEQRDAARIARDMAAANTDVVRYRIQAAAVHDGEVPLRSAHELALGALDTLQFAARAELARRPSFGGGQWPTQVRDFIDQTKLAGTERGSVILRVRTPALATPVQESIDSPQPSFERRAVTRLVQGFRAAKIAAHQDLAQEGPPLEAEVEDGLSANMCLALLHLAGEDSSLGATVSLNVRWALTFPTEEPATEVKIERAELRRLSDVAEVLQEVRPRPGFTVQGPVTKLDRDPTADAGWVTMKSDIDHEVRSVRVYLAREDYDKAITVHQSRLVRELRLTGTLEHAGRSRELADPTNIGIVDAGNAGGE